MNHECKYKIIVFVSLSSCFLSFKIAHDTSEILLLAFKSGKIKSLLYTVKIIISLSFVLGVMSIFSVITNPREWTCGIYCIKYRRRGKIIVTAHIRDNDLVAEELKEEIHPFLDPDNTNPNIDTVEVKRIPLDIGTVFSMIASCVSNAVYHAYVILKINRHYVSLEKHSHSLTIQTSEDVDDVLSKLRGYPRHGVPELIVKDTSSTTVQHLANIFVDSDFVHEGYNIVAGTHCKKFAKDIFDEVALTKKYNWEEEERREIQRLESYIILPAIAIIAEPAFRVGAAASNS